MNSTNSSGATKNSGFCNYKFGQNPSFASQNSASSNSSFGNYKFGP